MPKLFFLTPLYELIISLISIHKKEGGERYYGSKITKDLNAPGKLFSLLSDAGRLLAKEKSYDLNK